MSKVIQVLVWAFVGLSTVASARAETEVGVLGYKFPPFVEDGYGGLTSSLITLLNATQSEFKFSFVPTSPARRYRDLAGGRGNVIIFEMPEWGWRASGVETAESREIMKGGEVYITLANKGRDQSFFDDIGSKSIAAVLGYHYGFAKFNADPKFLTKTFDINLTFGVESIIKMVVKNRADVGVVTESYLAKYLKDHTEIIGRLLISKIRDQVYSLRAIVGSDSPISVPKLEAILDDLKANGALADLFKDYGFEKQLTY